MTGVPTPTVTDAAPGGQHDVDAWAQLQTAYELDETVGAELDDSHATYSVVVIDDLDRRAYLRLADGDDQHPKRVLASALDTSVELIDEDIDEPRILGVIDSFIENRGRDI